MNEHQNVAFAAIDSSLYYLKNVEDNLDLPELANDQPRYDDDDGHWVMILLNRSTEHFMLHQSFAPL